jgi:O-antigen/teichoic acid export membrane protein
MSEPAEVPVSGADLVEGGTQLLVAKAVAVVGGFALYWGLALAFTASLGEVAGTAALGVWGATFGIVNPISAMASAGTLQVMSRVTARQGQASAFRSTARAQLLLVGAVFLGLELAAGWIARHVLNDPSYTWPLRLAALIPVFYAWRALYEGYLNGARRFREQALLDIGATVLRLALILVGAIVGASALGAIGGFVAAAVGMALVAELWIRPERGVAEQPLRELWLFQAQVIGVTLATQYLLNVDLIAVKALASDVPAVADRLAGYYTAAQRIAQVPLSVVAAFPYLMFSYVAAGDRDVAHVVRLGLRALLLVIVPATVLLASNAHETLLLVFPSLGRTLAATGDPASAFSGPLVALALGYVPFSLLLTSTTLLTASGRPGLAGTIAGLTLVLAGVAVRIATPSYGPSGAAIAVSLAWTLGLLASGLALRKRTGGFVPPASVLRIAICAGLTWLASAMIQTSGLWLLVEDAFLALLYLGLLLLLREVSRDELAGALRLGWARR